MGSPVPVGFQIDRDLNKFLAHYSRDPSKTNVIDVDCISWSTEAERQARQKKYCEVATDYYNLVSFAYEKGWYVHTLSRCTLPHCGLTREQRTRAQGPALPLRPAHPRPLPDREHQGV